MRLRKLRSGNEGNTRIWFDDLEDSIDWVKRAGLVVVSWEVKVLKAVVAEARLPSTR